MLATRVDDLPPGETWIFEPKWDGFRALVFRDRDEIYIQSRDEKPLNRYFPELVEALRLQLPDRCVLDGEIVIARENALDFDALQLRLHPAASRVKLLSQQIPASIVFFDLLCLDHRDLRTEAFENRRRELENLLSSAITGRGSSSTNHLLQILIRQEVVGLQSGHVEEQDLNVVVHSGEGVPW